jgi:tetratricopeptide (TPR) repeat protein
MPDSVPSDATIAAGKSGGVAEGLAAAQAAAAAGDREAALRLLLSLRHDFPDHPAAYHRSGAMLLALDRVDSAEALLSDAAARFPDDTGIAMEWAQAAERRSDHTAAARRWERVQRLMPEQASGYFRRAQALREAGQLAAAEALLSAAASRFPNDISIASWYARLADLQEHRTEAEQRWQDVRQRFPDSPVGYLGAAVSWRESGRPDDEDRILTEAVAQFPDDVGTAVEYGSAAVRRRDWPEMLRRWEQMKTRFPQLHTGYTGMALPLREMGRFAEAERLMIDAMARFPQEAAPAIEYALVAQHQRDWPVALTRWEFVRTNFPAQTVGWLWSALALRHLERLEEAEAVAAAARERFPRDLGIIGESAHIAEARQDWAAAARCWSEVQSRQPQDVVVHRGLALALRELRQLDESDAALSSGLQRFPADRGLLMQHVENARRRNDWAAMLARLAVAAERCPHDSEIQLQFAAAQVRMTEPHAAPPAHGAAHAAQPRYLLFVANAVGLGHLFTAILHSAYYAWRTQRALVLDMRQVAYFAADKHAAFFECFGFEFPPELEVITEMAEIQRISEIEDRTWVSPTQTLDVTQPIEHAVLVVPAYTPGEPYSLGAKRADLPFRVVLRGRLLDAWNAIRAMPQWSGPVIGMHFRAFVGEIGPRMNRFLVPDFDARCDSLRDQFIDKALSIAVEEGYADAAVFVASDDARFAEYVKARLPNAFSLASRLPDQEWWAWMRANGHDIGILIDTVNDVWALGECEHLIYSTRSGFSRFAALNSQKLTAERIHPINIPLFGEILRGLEPALAADWARAALRTTETMRYREAYVADEIAQALERGGTEAEAMAARLRATWHRETALPPPSIRVAPGEEPAIIIARARAERSPGNPYVLSGYGDSLSEVLLRSGRLEEAAAAARRALELLPRDPYLHVQFGLVAMQQEHLEDAEAAFRQAIQIEPEVPRLYGLLSDCLARQGKLEPAIKVMEAAIALEPDDPHWNGKLGDLLIKAGRMAAAEQALARSVAADPSIMTYAHLLGIVLERQLRFAEAIPVVRRVQEQDPGNPTWSLRLGHVLQRAGRFAEAEQAYENALRLAPESKEARERLAALAREVAAAGSAGNAPAAT